MKGVWSGHVTHLKFLGPIHVSAMAETRVMKFLQSRLCQALALGSQTTRIVCGYDTHC